MTGDIACSYRFQRFEEDGCSADKVGRSDFRSADDRDEDRDEKDDWIGES